MAKKDDLRNVAVYFNNECIGEAKSFKFKKGNRRQMATLEIKGKYYAEEDKEVPD